MNKNLTEIVLVVDRSGSMAAIQSDAEGGVNTFIAEQKKQEGEANLTLVEFDDQYKFVHLGIPVQEAREYKLVPRGSTALLDAVGNAINQTVERLRVVEEEHQPACVIFVICTDGHENSSKEFKKAQIKALIERQKKEHNWQFTFLGADADAFGDARSMGINIHCTAQYDPHQPKTAYLAASNLVSRARSSASAGIPLGTGYTAEEHQDMTPKDTNGKPFKTGILPKEIFRVPAEHLQDDRLDTDTD